MAGDWIKMKRGLRHDPKVIAMARELGGMRDFMDWWSDPQRMSCADHVTEIVTFANVTRVTVCALLDVWASLNNSIAADGKAQFMTIQDLDDIAEMPGIGKAMESVGWVHENGDGGLEFPNFFENNSPSKSRGKPKSNAERQRAYRERKKESGPTDPNQGKALRNVTGEKRREEKSIKKPLNPQNGGKEWTPNPHQSRLSKLFNRRESTRWSAKELSSYGKLIIEEIDLALVERFHAAPGAYKRKGLFTLLNNFQEECERARNHFENPNLGKKEPTLAGGNPKDHKPIPDNERLF